MAYPENTVNDTGVKHIWDKITALLSGKVDKVTGKGLSTNDYTNEEKALVATIPDKADSADVEGTKTVSGNPITLTDASETYAESLVVELEPVQDLHGYDFPWVGGAGKNKLPMTVSGLKASNTGGTWNGNVFTHNNGVTFTVLTDADGNVTGIKVNGTASAQTLFIIAMSFSLTYESIINGCPANGSNSTYMLVAQPNADTGSGYILPANEARNIYINIASGYTASNLIFYPMVRPSTETDPTFAPYSNICPISGYEGVEVEDVGFNQWDEEWELGRYNTSNGEKQAATDRIRCKYAISVLENKTYYVKKNVGCVVFFYDKADNFISYSDLASTTGTEFTTPNNCSYVRFYLGSNYGTTYANDICINLSKPTGTPKNGDYVPYHSSNATIQFGQTVYGGSVDVTNGGTSDNMKKISLASLSWSQSVDSKGRRYSSALSDIYNYADFQSVPHLVCDSYKVVSGYELYTDTDLIGITTNQDKRIYIRTPDGEPPASGELCYELATPTIISTQPTDLKLLQGTNNITTNGTTINLGYQPDNVIGDVKGEIEKIIEMDYLRILDNNVDTPINNYRIYYHFISSAYTLVNMAEMLQHRFIFVEVIQNPSGTANHNLLHSALIDPRTIDGFTYLIKASGSDTICIESILDENKFNLSLRTTGGSYSDGDPTDYYVTIRMVD